MFFDDVKRARIHLFTDASTRFGFGGFYFFEELEHEDDWQWYTANLPPVLSSNRTLIDGCLV